MNPIKKALNRLAPFLHKTPLVSSAQLNSILGHNIIFKAEALQKTGSFKVRGALNHLLSLREKNLLPKGVVAYSTGNHGIATAYCAKLLGIKARVYLPANTAAIKQDQALSLDGEVVITESRQEAEDRAREDGERGFYYLHPSDSQEAIEGNATLLYEALGQTNTSIDAVFASCGGGGLLSGCFLAKEELRQDIKIIGVEPESANDAYISRNTGQIFRFDSSPITIADGLRTLGLSKRTFEYIKKLDDFITVSEDDIKYWTIWLMHLLKILCETSCAASMAGAYQWLQSQTSKKNLLVIISGGNIDPAILSQLNRGDYLLSKLENLEMRRIDEK
ncbi:MAG: pyridoxal-phosphate dependent enzyme [Alphaproteobacteria bacterium]|nr:pyridoxal-phosphate dependent enzyme [Alphaproteobacteria bacterium]